MLRGSLASPTPPNGGRREERGDEAHKTQSWRDLQGDKTLAELAEQFRVHATQITEWKQQWLARAADVFGGTKPTADTPDLKTLHAKIGPLALENDFLAGALTKAGLRSAKP